MSSWGARSFEDDFACDWLEDLNDSDPFAFFAHCLDLPEQKGLSFLACIGVRCSSEMIFGILDGPRDGLPEQALTWLESNRELDAEIKPLLPVAAEALLRVLQSDSAMEIKWRDAGPVHYDAWHEEMTELRKCVLRLNRPTSLS